MSRIAASLLIVCTVLAITTLSPQPGFAGEPALRPADVAARPAQGGREASRILALLVTLEALNPRPATSGRQ